MRRRLLQLLLLASAIGSICVWAVILTALPRLRAREVSNRLVDQAQQAGSTGDRNASREFADAALAADPSNPRAHRELAMHLVAHGDLEGASEELRRAAFADPTNAGAAVEMAAALYSTKDLKGALHWLREAAKRDPESGLAHAAIANCLIEIGDVPAALEAAERAVTLSPRCQFAYAVLGTARWQSHDLRGAAAAFEEAIRLRPNDVGTLLAAAAVADKMKRPDDALAYARRAVRIGPRDGRAWIILAHLLASRGESAESQQTLARARSLQTPSTSLR